MASGATTTTGESQLKMGLPRDMVAVDLPVVGAAGSAAGAASEDILRLDRVDVIESP